MGVLKALVVLGLMVAVIAGAVAAIVAILPYLIVGIILVAIAQWLVRQSDRKEETHSPGRNRPGRN